MSLAVLLGVDTPLIRHLSCGPVEKGNTRKSRPMLVQALEEIGFPSCLLREPRYLKPQGERQSESRM